MFLIILSFQGHNSIIWVYKFRFCREKKYSVVPIELTHYNRYHKHTLYFETVVLGNLFCSLQLLLCVP